jgi:sugar O-acyltransferase (sialic acid O-acetyltransferase NeuD family)
MVGALAQWRRMRDPVVLFGIGSPVVVDVEETLLRLNRPVAAAVRNVAGEIFVLSRDTVRDADELTADLLAVPFLVPLFTPAHRLTALNDARARGFRTAATIIDPTSVVPRSLVCGEGVYINAGCTIGGATRLGQFVFINRGASIGHHGDIGEFSSIGPGVVLAGQVRIGRGCVIGAGAVVLPGVHVGDHSVVSAGSLVTLDVADETLAAGHPARVVRPARGGSRDRRTAVQPSR